MASVKGKGMRMKGAVRVYGKLRVLGSILALLLLAGVGCPVMGQVQLIDQNSSLNFVTNSQAGINQWLIDGTSVLNQQWFWYRIGNSGG